MMTLYRSHSRSTIWLFSLDQLRRATSPNPVIIAPEILFTHKRALWSSLSRNAPTEKLRTSHQKREPEKTPATKAHADILVAVALLAVALIKPIPAKNAPNESTVMGFVSVRNNVWA